MVPGSLSGPHCRISSAETIAQSGRSRPNTMPTTPQDRAARNTCVAVNVAWL